MANGIDGPDDLEPTWSDLALALSVWRDALTDLSLSLHDHLFEFDAAHRQDAATLAQELSDRVMRSA